MGPLWVASHTLSNYVLEVYPPLAHGPFGKQSIFISTDNKIVAVHTKSLGNQLRIAVTVGHAQNLVPQTIVLAMPFESGQLLRKFRLAMSACIKHSKLSVSA